MTFDFSRLRAGHVVAFHGVTLDLLFSLVGPWVSSAPPPSWVFVSEMITTWSVLGLGVPGKVIGLTDYRTRTATPSRSSNRVVVMSDAEQGQRRGGRRDEGPDEGFEETLGDRGVATTLGP